MGTILKEVTFCCHMQETLFFDKLTRSICSEMESILVIILCMAVVYNASSAMNCEPRAVVASFCHRCCGACIALVAVIIGYIH